MLGSFAVYKWPIIGGISLVMLLGAYIKGRHDEDAKWQAKTTAAELRLSKIETRADSLARALMIETGKRITAELAHTSGVAVKIIEHRQEFDGTKIPASAIDLHNQAARGAK
jgi:hypothetical protein